MAAGKMKAALMRKALQMIGLDPDSSLLEVIEWANENFDLGAKLERMEPSTRSASAGLMPVAIEADRVAKAGKGEFYKVTAQLEGKPLSAFVVIG